MQTGVHFKQSEHKDSTQYLPLPRIRASGWWRTTRNITWQNEAKNRARLSDDYLCCCLECILCWYILWYSLEGASDIAAAMHDPYYSWTRGMQSFDPAVKDRQDNATWEIRDIKGKGKGVRWCLGVELVERWIAWIVLGEEDIVKILKMRFFLQNYISV